MTTKEWNKLKLWIESEKKLLKGSIGLYEESGLKFITNPCEKHLLNKPDLRWLYPNDRGFTILGDSIKFTLTQYKNCEGCIMPAKVLVPYKYIQFIRINNFRNY